MNSIDNGTMSMAQAYVNEARQYADIHTVTVKLNGHGGADVTVEGFTAEGKEYRTTLNVHDGDTDLNESYSPGTPEWVGALSDEELTERVERIRRGDSALGARLRKKLLAEAERRKL